MLRYWNWAVLEGRVDVIGNKEHRSKRSPSQASLLHCFLFACHFVTPNHYKEHSMNCLASAFSFHNNLQPCFLSWFLEQSQLLQIRSVLDPHDFHSSLCCRGLDRARVPLDVLILVETAVSLSAICWKRGVEWWNLKIGGSFYYRWICED